MGVYWLGWAMGLIGAALIYELEWHWLAKHVLVVLIYFLVGTIVAVVAQSGEGGR